MSALHRGYRTFAVHHEKSLVPAFFKVSIYHLFVYTLRAVVSPGRSVRPGETTARRVICL